MLWFTYPLGVRSSSRRAVPDLRTPLGVSPRLDESCWADQRCRSPTENTSGEIVAQLSRAFTSLISFRFNSPVRRSRPCSASFGSCFILPLISCFKPSTLSWMDCAGGLFISYVRGDSDVYIRRPLRIQDRGQLPRRGVEVGSQCPEVHWDSCLLWNCC